MQKIPKESTMKTAGFYQYKLLNKLIRRKVDKKVEILNMLLISIYIMHTHTKAALIRLKKC